MTLNEESLAMQPELTGLRRAFHSRPELSLQEFSTAQRIEALLDELSLPHRRIGQTGVLGLIQGRLPGGRVILLRADTDALPIQETNQVPYRSQVEGVAHVCGHDAHTACLLGAAKLLARRRETFGGEVRLIFQPGEEIGKGAEPFLTDEILKDAGRVFGLHTAPDLPAGTVGIKPGPNNAGVDFFRITISGQAAHVSTPHLGNDALYIASQLVVALQGLRTRCFSPVEPVIIGVGTFHAGSTYNAVASTAVLEGTTRTMTLETRRRVREKIEEAARSLSALYGGSAEFLWDDFAAPLLNDPAICREVTQTAERIFGPGKVRTDRALSLSGDNFAAFQSRIPGVYAYLGTANQNLPGTLHPAHSQSFDIDESVLPLGAALYAAYALDWLQEGS